jgi:ribosomal protein S15
MLALRTNPVRLSAPSTAARPAARGALRVQAIDKRSRCAVAEVAEFQRSPADCGSTEVQVALLSSRVVNLTKHLQQNKKDYDTQRGLLQVRHHCAAMRRWIAPRGVQGTITVGR